MSASMETFAWPFAVVFIVFVALFGFRKSVSKILEGIKLRKVPGAEFEQVPQPQIEEAKTDSKLSPANPVQEQSEINDPVLGPKIHALREELENLSKDPGQREKLLIRAIAVWQVNHENERVARYIFGSQLEILLLLNARPQWRDLREGSGYLRSSGAEFPGNLHILFLPTLPRIFGRSPIRDPGGRPINGNAQSQSVSSLPSSDR